MLLSTHQDAFHKLSEAAKRLQAELLNEGAFQVRIALFSRLFSALRVHKAGRPPCYAADFPGLNALSVLRIQKAGKCPGHAARGSVFQALCVLLTANIGLQDSAMPSIKAVPLSAFISGPAGVDCIL